MEIAEEEYNKLIQSYSQWQRSGNADIGCACPNYIPSPLWANELTVCNNPIEEDEPFCKHCKTILED